MGTHRIYQWQSAHKQHAEVWSIRNLKSNLVHHHPHCHVQKLSKTENASWVHYETQNPVLCVRNVYNNKTRTRTHTHTHNIQMFQSLLPTKIVLLATLGLSFPHQNLLNLPARYCIMCTPWGERESGKARQEHFKPCTTKWKAKWFIVKGNGLNTEHNFFSTLLSSFSHPSAPLPSPSPASLLLTRFFPHFFIFSWPK